MTPPKRDPLSAADYKALRRLVGGLSLRSLPRALEIGREMRASADLWEKHAGREVVRVARDRMRGDVRQRRSN